MAPMTTATRDANDNNNLALALAESLLRIITSTTTSTTTTKNSREDDNLSRRTGGWPSHPLAAAATSLVGQLAATEPPPPGSSPSRPFDEPRVGTGDGVRAPPSSWCAVLSGLCAPRALPSLLPPGGGAIVVNCDRDRDDRCDVGLYERCAWAIGNLSGDSEGNRTALLSAHDDNDGDGGSSGILPRLAGCLSLGTSILRRRRLLPRRHDGDGMIDPVLGPTAGMLRSAIWAVSNVIRGGRIVATTANAESTIGFLYVHDDGVPRGGRIGRLLTPGDAPLLLQGLGIPPPAVAAASAPLPRPPPRIMDAPRTTWDKVAVETCWLPSSLTRDRTMVEYFCSGGAEGDDGDVVSALVGRLARATFGSAAESSGDDEGAVGAGCLVKRSGIIDQV